MYLILNLLKSVGQGKFSGNPCINVMLPSRPSGAQPAIMKEVPTKGLQERSRATTVASPNHVNASNNSAPAAK